MGIRIGMRDYGGERRRLRKAEAIYLALVIPILMNRKIAAIWLTLLIVLSFIVIIVEIALVARAQTTWYVDDVPGSGGPGDPPEDFSSIQDAINVASDGDTVFVYNGTYYENVVVDKTVNLTGEDISITIIDGGGNGDVISIEADWVNISKFTIKNSGIFGGDSGIQLNSNFNNVSSNIIIDNSYGVYTYYSNNNTIINNNIISNSRGVYLAYSSNNKVINNNLSPTINICINLHFSDSNTIYGNDASSNTNRGIYLYESNANIVVKNNASYHTNYGIYLRFSDSNDVTENNASENWYGICLESSNGNNLTMNLAYNNVLGLFLDSSHLNNITDNNISDNNNGISVEYSNNNIIYDNNLSSNNGYGIALSYSNGNNISKNTILQNIWDGIYLGFSIGANIARNTMFENGIRIRGDLLDYWNTHIIDISNLVNNNPVYYWKNRIGGVVPMGAGQVILANCTGISIENQQLTFGSVGIELGFSHSNNVVLNNVSSNIHFGIYLSYSNQNSIMANIASFNGYYGIYLYYSNNNSIAQNMVTLNDDRGIYLDSSDDNEINLNSISYNTYGVYLQSSSNNLIFHNNIISNSNQGFDKSNNNDWNNDYPLGGNYWSDYSGIDNLKGPNKDIPGSDGMGDTSYIVDVDPKDNFPLMQPIENYSILKQGWNLISIPFIQENQNLSKVLEMIDGYYNAVQRYDVNDIRDHWKHNKIGKSFGNDLFNINEKMGFWIYIIPPQGAILLHNGTQPTSNQTIPLHPGWNMVGYPSLTSYNRTEGLNNLTFDDQVDAIWSYDAATQKWEEMGESNYFKIGRGYYIHAKSECEWEVPL